MYGKRARPAGIPLDLHPHWAERTAPEILFEPKARPRMLVMRWLRDLGYRQGRGLYSPHSGYRM